MPAAVFSGEGYSSLSSSKLFDQNAQNHKSPSAGLQQERELCGRMNPAAATPLTTQGFQKGARPFGPPEGPAGGIAVCISCRFRPVGRPTFLLAQKKEGKNCAFFGGGAPPLSARGSMTRSLLRVNVCGYKHHPDLRDRPKEPLGLDRYCCSAWMAGSDALLGVLRGNLFAEGVSKD